MGGTVTLKSAHDGTTLELFERGGGYFLARIAGPNFQATTKVYEYEPIYLTQFFADLAANWKGWTAKKEWGSLEGELHFSATCDSTGHINLSIQLRSSAHPFGWNLASTILLEAGQLDRLAQSVVAFFEGANVG
jgi:hypothetical protein